MTIDEIKSAVAANPDLTKDLITFVSDTDPGKELLTNHATAHFDQEFKPRIAKVYSDIDNDVFEIIGERKKDDQKTYDFVKEKMLELKELKAGASDDEKTKKINDLAKQLKEAQQASGNDKHWHGVHNEATKAWEAREKEYADTINQLKKEQLDGKVDADLRMGLSGLEFDPNVPQAAIDAMVESAKSRILQNAKIDESGTVYYHKHDGSPWLNKEFKPADAKGVLSEELASVMRKTASKGGAAPVDIKGSLQTIGEGENAVTKLVLDTSEFRTRKQFTDLAINTLQKQGVARGTKHFDSIMDGAYKEYKVADMPLQ